MNLFKLTQSLFLAATLALSAGISGASAQDVNARVVVPDVPGGANFAGCYRVAGPLYGPYTMTFCLKQKGTYTVTGGGIKCNGRLSWDSNGREIDIDLRRTSCGNGVAWSADSLTCRPLGIFGGIVPFVVIPDVPILSGLRCTYYPSAPGFKDTRITARRIS
jgi:hypothetical protein